MRSRLLLLIFAVLSPNTVFSADVPRGFFVEDLGHTPPVPAFYDIERKQVVPFVFRTSYDRFIEVVWDRDHKRVFFSARKTPKDPYRVYLKAWPNGEEKVVYENPLGPFRFLLSPDSQQLALQVQGSSAWPILAIHDWAQSKTISLGQGFSPDWSVDGQRLLYLQIPGSLPSFLAEYRVDTSTSTLLMEAPVAEAVYADSPDRIILKSLSQAKGCDEFQIWDRTRGSLLPFSTSRGTKATKHCSTQREINAFPGHQFLYFKESDTATDFSEQTLVVTDSSGGRLQILPNEKWDPKVTAVEEGTLVIGEDPLFVTSVDGAGGIAPIPKARFIRFQR